MFTADGECRHNVIDGHATLLAVAVEEAALSDEQLFLIGQQDVINAVGGGDNGLLNTVVKLAGSVRSLEPGN